jgi:hypothetical protein
MDTRNRSLFRPVFDRPGSRDPSTGSLRKQATKGDRPVLRDLPRRLENLVRRIEPTFPALRQWVGERLDLQVPAVAVSLLTHLMGLSALGMIGYAAVKPPVPEFRSEVVDTSLSDFATLDTTEIAQIEDTSITPVGGSFAPKNEALIVEKPLTPPVESKPVAPSLSAQEIQVASVSLPKPKKLDNSVSIRGSGAEHVENVEGAVDRIAVEIMRQLEKGRTLVVWAFDASGSLQAERQRLAKYIDGVYAHIDDLDQSDLSSNEGLLTSVVSFGHERKILTDSPTAERKVVVSAIGKVGLDKTGQESTFRTVAEIARKYARFSKNGQPYKVLCIVVTDEVGDDEENLETAISAANAAQMPVYVLGSPALFGRIDGFMDYTDPQTKKTFRHLPVRQGPEAAVVENLRLPFWYDGPQYSMMDSGFGPYALSRLAGATGGIYFITRINASNRINFDPAGMREYKPDWISKDKYMAMLNKSPLRHAVMRAALITQQQLPGMPSLTFPPIDAPSFKDVMTKNQELTARTQYTVDEALGISSRGGEPTIVSVSKLRDHETSKRWQAHYDLIRGRLMAAKIRCMEYNLACARLKKDMPKFSKPDSNAWRLVTDEQVHISEKAAEVAQETEELLKKVVKEHPGTPWALLAQRELKDPFGLKWVEVTLPPPPKPKPGGNNRPKKNEKMPSKPVEVPKL